jgi:hypothetical protein
VFAPPDQIHEGPIQDMSQQPLPRQGLIGQLNPYDQHRLAMQQGRWLSGVEQMEQPQEHVEWRDEDWGAEGVYDLEEQDDSFGTGIFDPPRRPGTSNTDAGVFASHYSLPGYLAREKWFEVSPEVSDATTGGAVVVVPAGGMAYVEEGGVPVEPRGGVIPPKPRYRPAPPTGRDQPYARLSSPTKGIDRAPMVAASKDAQPPQRFPRAPQMVGQPSYYQQGQGVGAVPPPPGQIARRSIYHERPVGKRPNWQPMARSPKLARLPHRMTVTPRDAATAIGQDEAGFEWTPTKLAVVGFAAAVALTLVLT